jgi:hypothetical protein
MQWDWNIWCEIFHLDDCSVYPLNLLRSTQPRSNQPHSETASRAPFDAGGPSSGCRLRVEHPLTAASSDDPPDAQLSNPQPPAAAADF